jgi:hypothetical protein
VAASHCSIVHVSAPVLFPVVLLLPLPPPPLLLLLLLPLCLLGPLTA